MNSTSVGELSEGMILARLLQLGISVSLPFGNNQRYDMIIEEGGKLLKVQCKTGRLRDGVILFPTCSRNGFTGVTRAYNGEADLFLVYCQDTQSVYKVPVDATGGKECSLRVSETKNKQARRIRMASDHKI